MVRPSHNRHGTGTNRVPGNKADVAVHLSHPEAQAASQGWHPIGIQRQLLPVARPNHRKDEPAGGCLGAGDLRPYQGEQDASRGGNLGWPSGSAISAEQTFGPWSVAGGLGVMSGGWQRHGLPRDPLTQPT